MNIKHIKKYLVISLILMSAGLKSQQTDTYIEGIVYSTESNHEIAGIKVSAKNIPLQSVSTDSSGYFKLLIVDSLNLKAVKLVLSYPGFNTKELYTDINSKVNIYMSKVGDMNLDEEMITSYGVINKNSLTGSFEKPGFNLSDQIFAESIGQLLQSSTVATTKSSGTPGEGLVLKIRGYSSIFANTKPLIVLDGQVLGNHTFDETSILGFFHNPLINIDPRDIEDISVLKDAAATAIYGAKGANGVIQIKTRSVKVGKTEFNVVGHYGTNFNPQRIPVMTDITEFKPYLLEQIYKAGEQNLFNYMFDESIQNANYYQHNNSTDWQDYIFNPGTTAGANLNVRGGDAIARYYISAGYLHNEGSVANTNYDRFNVRINANADVSTWMIAETNVNFTYSNGLYFDQGMSLSTNPVMTALVKPSFFHPFTKNNQNIDFPDIEDEDELGFTNPYALINKANLDLSSYNFIGSVNFKILLPRSLEGNIRVGTEQNKLKERVFIPDLGVANTEVYGAKQSVKHGANKFIRYSFDAYLEYKKTLQELHNVHFILGSRFNMDEATQDLASGVNTGSDEFQSLTQTSLQGRTKDGYQLLWRDFAAYTQASYNFKEKYFASASLTADASSSIGVDAGTHILGVPMAMSPTIGTSWIVSNEEFLSSAFSLDLLKVRLSGGQIARTNMNAYAAKEYYEPIQYYNTAGYVRNENSNTKLGWESTLKINLGIDISMYKQRLFFTADMFYYSTKDLLTFSLLDYYYGVDKYWNNEGKLNTYGFEICSKGKILTKKLKWNAGLTVASYKTRTIDLPGGEMIVDFGDGEKIFKNGEEAGLFYGYQAEGIIASSAEAGQLNLRDVSGLSFDAGDVKFKEIEVDGIINEKDKVAIGNPNPDLYGSFNNTFSYDFVSLSTEISFVLGNDIYNAPRRTLESMDGYENQTYATIRRWQVNGQMTDMPRSAYGDPLGNARFSDRWIEDGSFIRLKKITLSIQLDRWLKSTNQSVFYISGINLFTFNKYLGYDPEFAYNNSMIYQGIDYAKFPQNKSIMCGVKFGL